MTQENQTTTKKNQACFGNVLILTFLFVIQSAVLQAQIQLIPASDGGFENATSTFAANGWLTAQPGITRQWQVGTAAGSIAGGTKAAYLGAAANYNGNASGGAFHFYRDLVVPAGATNVTLTFNLRMPTIDDTYDSICVFTTSTANTPLSNVVPGAGYTVRFKNTATAYPAFTAIPAIDLTALAGTTIRLVFTAVSDGVAPVANPAIDNVSFSYIAGVACSGTPNAGTAQSSANPVCPSIPFTLSLSGTTAATGLTYLWQTSPDNSTWSPTGITTSTFATSQTAATYYRCEVTCSGSSSNSAPVLVNMTPLANCFCTPVYNNGCTNDYISNFILNSLANNTGSSCSSSPAGYSIFGTSPSNLTTTMAVGSSYQATITVETGNTTGTGVAIWIDYNNNAIFEAGEKSDNGATMFTPDATGFVTINVPALAPQGQHRMRVRSMRNTNSNAIDPCLAGNANGETEDYTVTLATVSACSGTPSAGNAQSSANIVCPSTSFTLSLTGSSVESGLTYQWQSSPDNSTYTNIPGANSSSFSTTQSVATYYHCVVTCSNGGSPATSASVHVLMNDACVCGAYCSATQTTGTCNIDEYISNIIFNTINNSSTCAQSLPSGYTNYTGINTVVQQGQSYNITVTNSNTFTGDQCHAFFDWNADGDWSDQDEDIALAGGPGVFTATVTVPMSAIIGQTRLRARVFFTGATPACGAVDYGEAEDYCINIIAAPPCSGTPVTSATVSQLNPACYNTPFLLSLSASYLFSQMTFQWQSAPDIGGSPGTFTNVPGSGTSASYSAMQTNTTWYHCIITCSNGGTPVISADLKVTTQLCYCIPVYSNGCSNGDLITNFTMNTLSNNSGLGCVSNPPGYIVYGSIPSNLTTTLFPGVTYTATITVATGNANGTGVAIWIDLNDNGVFEPAENSNNGATKFASNTTGTLNVTIPANAAPGVHRMRVRSMRNTNSNAIDPCAAINANGEAEDYLVTIAPPSASVAGSFCEGAPIYLSVVPSGATSYSWSGPNGFNSSQQNPVIPVSAMADTGVYTVSVVIGSTTYTPTVHVSLFRSPAPYVFPNDTFLCSGSIITIEAKDLSVFSTGWPAGTSFDFGFGPSPDSAFLVNGPGTYNVTVTLPVTIGGCSATSTNADILYRDSPVLLLDADAAKCHGTNTGYVSAQVFLGSAPYRFVYYNNTGSVVRDVTTGFPADTLFNAGAGEYCVIAYDTVTAVYPPPSCRSDSTCIIVTEPLLLEASETHGNILCHGGTAVVSISASGGTPPYSGTGNFLQSAGLITYVVTDAYGCTAPVLLTLTQPSSLSVSLSVTASPCSYLTGSIAGLYSGGIPSYEYAWSNGASLSSLTSVPGGTYTVTVTDINSCSATSSAVVIAPGPVSLTGSHVNLLCRGVSSGAISPLVNGGFAPYNYLWNNGNTAASRSSLAAGTYTVTVTDANGCTKTKTWAITQPATNLLLNTTQTNVRCYGGNSGLATVSPAGGTAPYTFSWNTFPVQTTATVIGLPAGVYTCNVTDAIGCSKNILVTITQPADIIVFQSQFNVTFPGGNNGSATVSVTGGTPGYAYSWNTTPVKTTSTASGLTAGTYKCTITDTKGCSKKVTFIITEPIAKDQVKDAEWSINCYPNPTAGLMVISFEQAEPGWFRLELTDYTGRLLISNDRDAAQGRNEFVYDFTNLSKGIYFIKLSESGRSKTVRIAIQ